ncbi:MAG: hypothetical protein E6R04_05480 [Spirochaetes bacterium]|nr:MAG: hypothetical protein E6R04_05480 [Spirochaetota bacterium]
MGLKKIVKKAGSSLVEGTVQTASAAGAQLASATRRAVNVGSGILSGDTEKVQSNLSAYKQDFEQNVKAGASGFTKAATYGKVNIFSGEQNSIQTEKEKEKAALAAEQAALAAEEATRPERERQSLLSGQYSALMARNKGKGFNTLLGGGAY